ncbi:MAG: hypothetical protein K2X29_01040 [Candidatus Obscuribacterales bacterium]|nr:hypothetical protein [Candidatus Obscuribacterales bacterium]
MTENPNDQEPQLEQNACAAEVLSIPQEEGEPCTYCADEHPQPKLAAEKPKDKANRKSKRPRTRKQPTEAPPKKKGNWFSELSIPWKLVAAACALLASLGLGKCCVDLPKAPSGANCPHQITAPVAGAITVSQADAAGCFNGRTTYQYETVNGIKQLLSAKHFTDSGKLAASLTFTRDASGASCLIQLAIYDNEDKVSELYSDTKLPDSSVLNKQFDLWSQFGQLN